MINTNRWAFAAFNHVLLAGAFCASSACGALAEPITYKFTVQGPGQSQVAGVVGFDGTLGGQPIGGGDDLITFTFVGDTSNVQPFAVPGAQGFVNAIGTGSFSVADLNNGQVVAKGTFLPGDGIFVSVDDLNGGIGFGSLYNPPGGDSDHPFPGDATYPLGLRFDAATTQYDLQSEIGIIGSGSQSCAGFPNACIPPPILDTTAGDLVLAASDTPPGGSGAQYSTFGTFVAEFPTVTPPPPPAPVPEPSTWAMMLIGFAGLGYAGYRQSKRVSPVHA
jgi:hypothetical protein